MKFGITVAALLNLGLWSFLIGDNRVFRLVQSLYVGAAVAHTFVLAYRNTLIPNLWQPFTEGKYVLIVPMVLGLALFTRVTKKYSHISKIPMTFIGRGLPWLSAVPCCLTWLPSCVSHGALNTVDNIVMLIGTLCTLIYFTLRSSRHL